MVHRIVEVLLATLKLGLTSFGGPVAHIGYFRDEYVTRRRWLDEAAYADLVALCQVLPGPASSQVGIAVGMTRAGIGGGIAAWLGFTLPSAALLILFGYGVATFDVLVTGGWLRGLKVVAVAVVALAVVGMAQNLAPDRTRATIAVLAAVGMLFWRTPLTQVLVIVLAGGVGWFLLQRPVLAAGQSQPGPSRPHDTSGVAGAAGARHLGDVEQGETADTAAPGGAAGSHRLRGAAAAGGGRQPAARQPVGTGGARGAEDARGVGRAGGIAVAVGCLVLFLLLLAGLPVVRQLAAGGWLDLFDAFYRSGALVFGGGHVVLPLLQAEVVAPGWVSRDQFIAGYGAAQAIPGPLFTFSAYLGTVMAGPLGGWRGGLFTLGAIFLPSFLLLIGILPFWNRLRSIARFRAALAGVNAAVVGLLLAALYDPVWLSAIHTPADLALGLAAFAMLAWWKLPPWLVVMFGAAVGVALTILSS